MKLLFLLVLAPLTTGQSSGPQEWILHNRVIGVVETRIITERDIAERVSDPASGYTISNRADYQRASQAEFTNAVSNHIRSLGGEEMGLRDEDIQRVMAQQEDDQLGELTLHEQKDFFARRNTDPSRNRQEMLRDLYVRVWEGGVLGYNASGLGRKSVDRWVRPAFLEVLYEENRASLADPPARYRFQALIVSSRAAGGLENARAVCESELQEMIAGKDIATSIEEVGSELRDREGDTGWVPAWGVGEEEGKFAANSLVGTLSDPMPWVDPRTGNIEGYQVLQLTGREEAGDPPPFGDRSVQFYLRKTFTDRLDDYLLRRAEQSLVRRAYVWADGQP